MVMKIFWLGGVTEEVIAIVWFPWFLFFIFFFSLVSLDKNHESIGAMLPLLPSFIKFKLKIELVY